MTRVLVTGVGGPAGSSLARQLRAKGHWVLGVDMQPVDTGVVDGFHRVPAAGAPHYLGVLRGLVDAYGIELLLPTVSDELVPVSGGKGGFGPGVEVLIGEPPPVRTANDKYLTMSALRRAGIAVPDFGLPSEFGSAGEAIERFGGPVVVKPRVSRGGRGVQIVEPSDDDGGPLAARLLPAVGDSWPALDDSWIVQQFAPGTEYAPVVLRCGPVPGPDDLVVVLEKTALKEGRIGNAVSVRRLEPPAGADVAEVAVSAVVALGLTGPVDIDIRRMPDGTPVVLEVNARFGANSAHAPELLESILGRHAPDRLQRRTV